MLNNIPPYLLSHTFRNYFGLTPEEFAAESVQININADVQNNYTTANSTDGGKH